MKRLLGLLLVMGMVGCGAPEWVERDGLMYEGDSETPFTGVVVGKLEYGRRYERTYKDGKKDGQSTTWWDNGQKASEITYKDGKFDGLMTGWFDNGQKKMEATYKDGKQVSLTMWDKEGNETKE